ncbi:hypothetical protein SPRG_15041 [Saprolegnia parasitica CBS 223.65]|uniref:GMP phosphodiesterase delta subunit domain-containing protein n=1 Tax=Saprolegnia parasitica (strain CBS 223.65) TaxID=695850 RepID=A0A067BR46_SAPPC|nr:hypothetical protein SPRG_15041 [Saprolegnia parasitica CBS 223.65]XP_012211685.1 hypothetical protein SPRG_16984 [Saprolegnia parasitica CBS 223.65]KDO17606.1 hypothetical protein SPRG_16984 [Saprolegnia parasitica CBS 223.65]KDO19260.1 hypothetical protein SPRG_15041 [Saprolegnia parasitica CBS 223.65]|eukprot:XP_012210034.1 hypothetical protein SPRG_15041 [Saprolegnia parasitica CBS 223.65]
MPRESYTPEDILDLETPTKSFLCPMSANVYGIDFLKFQIIDYDTKRKIFQVGRDCPPRAAAKIDFSQPLDEDSFRKIRYEFSDDVLRLPSIMTSLEFCVGPKEVHNFRMIERHYFRDELIKSYDFTFGFCIPSSTNTWDAIYSVPSLDEDLIQDMVANPYATVSDSFYFVGDELIMHNKAEYKYILEDRAQSKRSYYDSDDDDAKDAKGAKAGDAKRASAKETKWSKEDDYDA